MRRKGWGSAQRTSYGGVIYASKSEASYARYLDLMLKAGQVEWWERQVTLDLVVNGHKICRMVPDFRVKWRNIKKPILVEVKGMETPVYKLKRKLLAALYPNLDYRVVKARAALAL